MLALSTAQEGDVAVRTDLNKSFILKTTGYSTLANWQELLTPTDKVQSVNGKSGTVTISLSELGGVSTSTFSSHTSSAVHLTSLQTDKLANLDNTRIDSSSDGCILQSDLDLYEKAIVYQGLVVFTETLPDSNPHELVYHIGIDKTKVLLPTSIIDGGTF